MVRRWARLTGGFAPPSGPPRSDPVTGDVELTFLYPAHTGRPPRTVSGTGGEVRPNGAGITLTNAGTPYISTDAGAQSSPRLAGTLLTAVLGSSMAIKEILDLGERLRKRGR